MRDAANEIVVSAATVWEISIKRAIGKLRFDRPIVAAVLALGFEILPVEGAHAEHAGGLPPHHNSPFDRLIIAQAVLEKLVKHCDVLVENFAPGALDRMGFSWERIQQLNPKMIVASVKGFGPGPYEECKVYENVAQCAGGSASTTGFDDGPPLVTGSIAVPPLNTSGN